MLGIISIINTVLAIIAAAAAAGVALPPQLVAIIQKIQTIAGGLTGFLPPTSVANDLTDLELALAELQKVAPTVAPTEVALALDYLSKYKTADFNYTSGQVAVLDATFSYKGIPGDIVAVPRGSAPSTALGLS